MYNGNINSNQNIALDNTYLPRNYYDDVIDNLELVSLNMINDLKSLIKSQKKMKVNRFDKSSLTNLQGAVKEQFFEVGEYRQRQKQKIFEEFKKAETDIEEFLKEKFKPSQELFKEFENDLKSDKQSINYRLNGILDSLKTEDHNVRRLLLHSKDPVIKYAAQKVYYPNRPSELELAINWRKKYGTDNDIRKINDLLAKYPLKFPIPHDDNVVDKDESEHVSRKTTSRIQTLLDNQIEFPSDEESVDKKGESESESESESSVHTTETEKNRRKERKKQVLGNLRIIAYSVIAARKLLLIKRWKKFNRIKDFSKSLVETEEYINKLFEKFLSGVFNNIAEFKEKFDLKNKFHIDKLEGFLRNITDNLLIKTTKIKINRTISLFFRSYIFQMDIVPKEFFSRFERLRIQYIPNGEINDEQKKFIIVMKFIINTLLYENLGQRIIESKSNVVSYNFKIIATIFYYSFILHYNQVFPKLIQEFNNDHEEKNFYISIYKPNQNIDDIFNKALKKLDTLRKKQVEKIEKYKSINRKYIVTYNPDNLPDDIEELRNFVLPFEEVEIYLDAPTDYDLIDNIEKWASNVLSYMNSHKEIYLYDA